MCCFVLVYIAGPFGMLWSFQRHSFPVIFMVKRRVENVEFKKAKGILDTMLRSSDLSTQIQDKQSIDSVSIIRQCFIEYFILSLLIGGIPAIDFTYNESLVMTVR